MTITQEEKQLLFQDLSARLPYGVKIKRSNCPINLSVTGILGEYVHHIPYYVGGNIEIKTTKIDEIKPYLRPMSSMTDKEEREFEETLQYTQYTLESYDWLNAHHFDYRGLITKGFALEAPKDMYNIE